MAFKRTKKAIKKTTDGIKKTSRNIKKTTDDISDNITDNIDETKFKIKMKANEFADNIDKTKKKIKVNVKVTRPVPVLGPKPVSVEKWVEIVKSFQEITFDSNGHFIKIDLDAKKVERDPWISWNMKRDKIME